MVVFVLGATGKTGSQVVLQLLDRGQDVRAVVRSAGRFPEPTLSNPRLHLIQASLLDLSDEKLAEHIQGCTHVVQCLGHNLSFKGMCGHPRKLVLDATSKVCRAIEILQSEIPIGFVLMSTNGALRSGEKSDCRTSCVLKCLRCSVPPVLDNELAADYLQYEVGIENRVIEWVAVRPSNLTDEELSAKYEVFAVQSMSPIFGMEAVSRANVAHFMCELTSSEKIWAAWKFKFPVLVNASETA